MHQIPLSAVVSWTNRAVVGRWTPEALDTSCPHCGRLLTLTLGAAAYDAPRDTAAFTARCPACSKSASIWTVGPGDGRDPSARTCDGVFIYPRPPQKRQPVT